MSYKKISRKSILNSPADSQNDYVADGTVNYTVTNISVKICHTIPPSFAEMIGYKLVKYSFTVQDVWVTCQALLAKRKGPSPALLSDYRWPITVYVFTEQLGRLIQYLHGMSSVNEQKIISVTINVKTPKEMAAPKTRLLKQYSKCLLFVNVYKMVG